MKELITLGQFIYGSHLYGTNTPTSDQDFKEIYLPDGAGLLLGHKPKTYKVRYDADGNAVPDDQSMPANGVEVERIPLQNFVDHWLSGQAYAVELVYATSNAKLDDKFAKLLEWMREHPHKNVYGMLGFAQKQVIDYVKRGQRKVAAEKLHAAISLWKAKRDGLRLDSVVNGARIIIHLSAELGLETGTTMNNNRTFKTLKLNGREYLETTTLDHLQNAVKKLIDGYGERSSNAAEKEVDWKSLMHSKRVFEQVREYLLYKTITFPRPNVPELLDVKNGKVDLEFVKTELEGLDNGVQHLCNVSEYADPKTMRDALDEKILDFYES